MIRKINFWIPEYQEIIVPAHKKTIYTGCRYAEIEFETDGKDVMKDAFEALRKQEGIGVEVMYWDWLDV